jgi:hypothetical protein
MNSWTVITLWRRSLVCDDYAGYKALFERGVIEIGCMAHARRKFHDLYANHRSDLADTMRSRLTAKVHEITLELRRRLHEPIFSQGKWLGAVLRGHFAPTNIEALDVLQTEVTHRWFKSLRRRSQRRRLNWTRMDRRAQHWLPRARIVHPWPQQRFAVRTRDKSPVR